MDNKLQMALEKARAAQEQAGDGLQLLGEITAERMAGGEGGSADPSAASQPEIAELLTATTQLSTSHGLLKIVVDQLKDMLDHRASDT